ncbi:YaaR family protein [bacterium]|nr:YaaR family protein [bacterium]MBU1614831.1 YaaR family protein [bacterium]
MKVSKSSGSSGQRVASRATGSTKEEKREGQKRVEGTKPIFAESLTTIVDEEVKRSLDEVLSRIDEISQRLTEAPTYENVVSYARAVKDFMEEVIDKLYRRTERFGIKTREGQKIYTLVQTVDEKLSALTKKVLESQADSLGLASRVGEIRGMLVDLYT